MVAAVLVAASLSASACSVGGVTTLGDEAGAGGDALGAGDLAVSTAAGDDAGKAGDRYDLRRPSLVSCDISLAPSCRACLTTSCGSLMGPECLASPPCAAAVDRFSACMGSSSACFSELQFDPNVPGGLILCAPRCFGSCLCNPD